MKKMMITDKNDKDDDGQSYNDNLIQFTTNVLYSVSVKLKVTFYRYGLFTRHTIDCKITKGVLFSFKRFPSLSFLTQNFKKRSHTLNLHYIQTGKPDKFINYYHKQYVKTLNETHLTRVFNHKAVAHISISFIFISYQFLIKASNKKYIAD